MKAYYVHDDAYDDEGYHAIIFAENEEAARVAGAKESDCEAEYLVVIHKPDFDQYAPLGYVPKKAMLADGWWFECDCYDRVDSDNAVVIKEEVFCNKCKTPLPKRTFKVRRRAA